MGRMLGFICWDCSEGKDKNNLWKTKLYSYDESFDYIVAVLLCIIFKGLRNMCSTFSSNKDNKYDFFLLNVISFLEKTNIKESDI